jgi:hypothetical protein
MDDALAANPSNEFLLSLSEKLDAADLPSEK